MNIFKKSFNNIKRIHYEDKFIYYHNLWTIYMDMLEIMKNNTKRTQVENIIKRLDNKMINILCKIWELL